MHYVVLAQMIQPLSGTEIAAIIIALGTFLTSFVAAIVSVVGVIVSMHNRQRAQKIERTVNETKVAVDQNTDTTVLLGTRAAAAAEASKVAVGEVRKIVQNGHGKS